MSRISSLYRLQELDLEIDRSRQRIDDINDALSNDSAVVEAQRLYDEAEAKWIEVRAANARAEHAVESQRSKIEETDTKLYSGSVTNPKELQDLQLESESLKRYLSTLEETLLEAMVALDDAEMEFERTKNEKSLVDTKALVQNEELSDERQNLLSAIEDRSVERDAVLVDILEEDLAIYEKLRSRLGGMAIAQLQDESCAACGANQPRSKLQEIRTGADMVYCAQCGRILYSG